MKLTIIITLMFLLMGCAQTRKFSVDISKEEVLNVKMGLEVANNYLTAWSFQSGLATCGAEDFMPPLTLAKIQKVDKQVNAIGKWNNDEYERGCFLGRRGYLTVDQLKKFIEWLIPIVTKAFG